MNAIRRLRQRIRIWRANRALRFIGHNCAVVVLIPELTTEGRIRDVQVGRCRCSADLAEAAIDAAADDVDRQWNALYQAYDILNNEDDEA